MKRKIPSTMVSQHPDHAQKPYWHTEAFIGTHHEVQECFLSFSELGVSEYKWDWEGKFVDESVLERLFSQYFSYFQNHPLGKDKFLTFRLPNPKVETEFRLGRAFMGILSAAGLARRIGLHTPPLFEVILPMTETAEEMISIQEAFHEIASLKHHLYNFDDATLKHIEVIPLFEQVEVIIESDKILKKYLSFHKQRFGVFPSSLRPYVARSDPALNSGLVPSVIAIKIALSRYTKLEKELGIPLYPIIGSASLPFRGGLTPLTVEQFAKEYKGVRTALLQSAFRYDFAIKDVTEGISKLDNLLPQGEAMRIFSKEERLLKKTIALFEQHYRESIEELSSLINTVSTYFPKRRERVLHIGLFGYSRGMGNVRLPRAIPFTGALYSLGIPPELIGTGRGISKARKDGGLEMVEKHYVYLKNDLRRAGRFVNKEQLVKMAKASSLWKRILEDVRFVEDYLEEELGPIHADEQEHKNLVKNIWDIVNRQKDYSALPTYLHDASVLRKSVG